MNNRAELLLPFAIFGVTFGTVFCCFSKMTFVERLIPLAEPAINISTISIGFLATVKTVLISIEDRYIIKEMKKAGIYKILMNHLMRSIWFSLFLALASAMIILVDLRDGSIIDQLTVSIWLGFAATCMYSCTAVVHNFCKIVTFGAGE